MIGKPFGSPEQNSLETAVEQKYLQSRNSRRIKAVGKLRDVPALDGPMKSGAACLDQRRVYAGVIVRDNNGLKLALLLQFGDWRVTRPSHLRVFFCCERLSASMARSLHLSFICIPQSTRALDQGGVDCGIQIKLKCSDRAILAERRSQQKKSPWVFA